MKKYKDVKENLLKDLETKKEYDKLSELYNTENTQLVYLKKYWKLRKIYLKLVRHHGAALLESVWLKEDVKSLKQELKKTLNTMKYLTGNSNELMNIVDDFILTIDTAVERHPDLERLFEDNTDWYKDLAKHTR